MTEHVHEWTWKPWYEVRKFVCIAKDCHAILTTVEAERRLNATEKLSADAADYAAEFTQAGTNKHGMDQESEGNRYYLTDALRAYAAAREDIE